MAGSTSPGGRCRSLIVRRSRASIGQHLQAHADGDPRQGTATRNLASIHFGLPLVVQFA
jgi:hypothetical protein